MLLIIPDERSCNSASDRNALMETLIRRISCTDLLTILDLAGREGDEPRYVIASDGNKQRSINEDKLPVVGYQVVKARAGIAYRDTETDRQEDEQRDQRTDSGAYYTAVSAADEHLSIPSVKQQTQPG